MKKIKFLIVGSVFLTSCTMTKHTTQELKQMNRIDYELDKLYLEYQLKSDSLIIEYNNIKYK